MIDLAMTVVMGRSITTDAGGSELVSVRQFRVPDKLRRPVLPAGRSLRLPTRRPAIVSVPRRTMDPMGKYNASDAANAARL
ncbi:hypothetical protein [Nocardia sp. NPDC052316]|uniref:hypothetical protein n=1 Tax=Nocardia sp. NPDC052316 TaxID=3364329 RepID=UPI0037C6AA89